MGERKAMFHKFNLILLLGCLVICAGCNSNKLPPIEGVQGQRFPRVSGQDLNGKLVVLPDDFAGRPALFIIGYERKAQFDIDRWILGLAQSGIKIPIVEVPTIEGLVPGLASKWIDDGMRSGIPHEDWSSVVTIYEHAQKITDALGKTETQNAQIVLLDGSSAISWFYNRGYSASMLLTLKDKIANLESGLTLETTSTSNTQRTGQEVPKPQRVPHIDLYGSAAAAPTAAPIKQDPVHYDNSPTSYGERW